MAAGATYDAYVRVSSRGGRERLYSPEEQLDAIRAFARSARIRLGAVHEDIDVSGAAERRASLDRIIERIKSGTTEGLVVAKWDRVARDNWLGQEIPRRVRAAGGQMLSAAEPLDLSTPEGKLQYAQAIGFATFFRDRQNAGFELAKKRSIEAGVFIGGTPPAGYLIDDDTRRLVLDREAAPHIAEAFRLRAAGESLAAVGRYLAAQGVKTPAGNPSWSPTTVKRVIENRVYLGELSYGARTRNGDSAFPAYVNRTGHDPIIDAETWEAAQRPTIASPRSRTNPLLLTGILRCGGCRYRLRAAWEKGRQRKVYACKTPGCASPAYVCGSRAEQLEQEVEDAFWSVVRDWQGIGQERDRDERTDELRAAVERTRRELEAYRDDPDLETTIATVGRRVWNDGFAKRAEALSDAEAALGAHLASVRRQRAPELVSLRQDAWARLSLVDKRRLIAAALACVVVRRPERQRGPLDAVALAAGTAPLDLPERGSYAGPVRPFQFADGPG